MLRKLRMAYLLPAVQVSTTAVLTFWADRVTWLILGDSSLIWTYKAECFKCAKAHGEGNSASRKRWIQFGLWSYPPKRVRI